MIKKLLFLGMLFVALSGCGNEDSATVSELSGTKESDGQEAEVIAENLAIPWSIERHNETFYISERGGTIAKISDGEVERQSVSLERPLSSASEAGLLGFVLYPDFSESQKGIAYYTYEDNGNRLNRIVELTLANDEWQETAVLLDGIPSGSTHHGGRIKIGPDKKIYATTGDASQPDLAQDRDSLAGKILRLNFDGSIPDDNPFSNSYVYSYGHRNAQGLTWSSDETMYASEHGASANDEINRIREGRNYGWPDIEGSEERDGMESPLFTSGNSQTWAPSGMAYKDEALYVAGLRGTAILRFDLDSEEEKQVVNGFGRIRDVFIDGNTLYFVTNNRDGRGSPDNQDDRLVKVSLSSLD
ncbi:PQQ-dependent sugar dehydrogenase [Enterococcus gilvus]|uniref:PQQ-dependent sugar dehydrogenase n=1 Tax=Enterococcus gilvus TaxID=160453 RepID=UPI002913D2DF|nr:PQQ-dependent sugar dehydrogenase [Enterococcus gilvus]MDU5509627.1 PQQ-dependent sugar dehydrogenase [Enterococcus gilvus]